MSIVCFYRKVFEQKNLNNLTLEYFFSTVRTTSRCRQFNIGLSNVAAIKKCKVGGRCKRQ